MSNNWKIGNWIYTGIVCCLASTGVLNAKNKVLFEIGQKDNTPSEFALYPNKYKNFLVDYGGVKSYWVGYSTPCQNWPYAFPGPLDNWGGGGYWAGFHPRHFPEIYFPVSKVAEEGMCRIQFSFVGVRKSEHTVMRVEVNGHRFEKELTGRSSDKLLTGEEEPAPVEMRLDFPAQWLEVGNNKIQIGLTKGHWCVFDGICLQAPEETELGAASSTLIRSARMAEFERKGEDGTSYQPLLVDMVQYDTDRELTFCVGSHQVVRTIEKGESVQQINLPAWKKGKKNEVLVIKEKDKVVYTTGITRSPQPGHTYADDVDLLMGTGNSRWMFKPSVSLPLGMVQIAPDNQDETWKAGYEYTIENIMGFNHISDWTMTGFLMQPTCGPLQTNPGREDCPDEGYRSRIDKRTEKAGVGEYSVFMTDTKIRAKVTSTAHAAMQVYTFPKRNDARVLIDMFAPNEYPHNLKHAFVRKVSNTEIEGYATYYNAFTGYTLEQEYTLHFVLQFSKPFKAMNGWVNNRVQPVEGYIPNWNRTHTFDTEPEILYNINKVEGKGDMGIFLDYETAEQEDIIVRSGISLVDIDGARRNLTKEIVEPFGWNYAQVVEQARTVWNDYLSRIEIETDDYLQQKKFYTNYYRALAAKATWNDWDGRFVDEQERICQLPSTKDCIVSGEYWNTFWDNQPLFNLVAPEISSAWARSAIQLYQNSGWFNTDPAGIEHTGVMVAMHVASQIGGAWQSGIRDFDLETAYQGLKKMLTTPPQVYKGGGTVGVEHLVPYMKYGYVPLHKGQVSNTMEYAYDDWCLAQMAKALGKEEDYRYFQKRSENWKNIFDPQSGFVRPKDSLGRWVEPFDPYHTPGFTEGNAFNYSWFVPHNPKELVRMVGKERFVERLNEAMERSALANFNASGDDFANYPINHGNETSMEVAYLFNWADEPKLTQKWVRAIQEQYYGTTPYDAYPGDEDLGQMSSWFVMSALGLFQMDGGCAEEPMYEIGSPRYPKVTIHLGKRYGRGETFVIEARQASKRNKYVHNAVLNGKPVDGFLIPQKEVLKGGKLTLTMKED